MKKLMYLTVLIIGLTTQFEARTQGVAINNDNSNPDPSAILDIKSTTKGLLLPRMTLAQRNAIPSPANGLMIYQTDNTPGFYYNSGTSGSPAWVISGTGSGWGLTGNSGTSAGTNFIGTTDNVPLTFKVNNQLAGKIDPSTLNTSIGYQSLNSNTTGSANTAYGTNALNYNTEGNANTANGAAALYSNKANSQSTAIGYNAMHFADDRTTGRVTYNTAIGVEALKGSTTASDNTGRWNTAIGYQSMFSNTSGNGNTANGVLALQYNTTGTSNTANGSYALQYNTIGSGNTADGGYVLQYNTEGVYNTASGIGALFHNTTGSKNTANGAEALTYNTQGWYNTANGYWALYDNYSGSYNTAIGYLAMQTNTNGNWNTCIGEYTNTSISNLQGASSFGASAIVNADNKIVIGASVAGMVIGGYVDWSILSDGRFKEDIKENVPGLAFISQLRPVTYWINTDKLQRHITAQMPDSIAQHYLPSVEEQAKDREYTHTGFVAQEVESTAKAIGYAFDGVNAPKNPTDNYSIAYSQFVPSLVKAVQEQQVMIDDLKSQNAELIKRIEKLESK
jgi:trimeric autotransporter adhesin